MKRPATVLLLLLILAILAIGPAGCDQVGELTDLAEQAGDLGEKVGDLAEQAGNALDDLSEATSALDNLTGTATHTATSAGTGQTISDYFGNRDFYFYHQIVSETISPVSGNCPAETNNSKYMVNEDCFFCDEGSEIYDDTIILHIGHVGGADSLAGCTTQYDYDWPAELTITKKTYDTIIATGTGTGHIEQTGSNCDNYAYDYTTEETFIFTTEKLEDLVTLEATSGAPLLVFTVTGFENGGDTMNYSDYGLIVTVKSPYDFLIIPDIELVEIKDFRLNDSLLKINPVTVDENTTRYHFNAMFNGDYIIRATCRVIGKNGQLLRRIVDDTLWTVRVSGSPQGDLPD